MPSYEKDSKESVLVNRYLTAQTIKPSSKLHFLAIIPTWCRNSNRWAWILHCVLWKIRL